MRLLALLVLTSCASQPQIISKASDERVVMYPRWKATQAEVEAVCGPRRLACARRERIGDEWYAYITALQPRDFDDTERLETLGHEAWHGFGASHMRTGKTTAP